MDEHPAIASHSCLLTEKQGDRLRALLEERGWELQSKPHSRFQARKERTTATLYQSGKLLIQGKGTREFILFLLEPEVLKEARLGYQEVHDPDSLAPRLGVDESGKGDFFGPLCIAAVYVNSAVVQHLQQAGVQDSKQIKSDERISRIARRIRSTPGLFFTRVVLSNQRYNDLHAAMGNVNRILAWGHARAIENLMDERPEMDPAPLMAVVDQFSRDKSRVQKALMEKGRGLKLVQRHKAESDMAVAAASILARDDFVHRLARPRGQAPDRLPQGCLQGR